MWFVYIIKAQNGNFYTGITKDLERRLNEHKSGKGAKFFRSSKAVKILWSESHKNRSKATKREIEIKKMSRKEKEILIK